jgi:hypothetical protein
LHEARVRAGVCAHFRHAADVAPEHAPRAIVHEAAVRVCSVASLAGKRSILELVRTGRRRVSLFAPGPNTATILHRLRNACRARRQSRLRPVTMNINHETRSRKCHERTGESAYVGTS